MELFTDEWARAWKAEINADRNWNESGRSWRGSILFRIWPDSKGPGRALFLDIEDGSCRDARAARETDDARAPWVFGGPLDVWRAVVAGEIDPIAGIMQGRLRLERGNLVALAPHARSAKALLASAGRIGVRRGPPDNGPRRRPESYPQRKPRGFNALDPGLFPMKLWQQAKKQGNWDPRDQRLDRDLEDWKSLQQPERDVILWLVAMFQLGKQSLLPAIMPLISIHAAEGRLEETVYLTSLLAEEARHLEMFHRFLDEVASDATDLARLRGPGLSRFLDAELPATTERLSSDVSPESQARAWVTCNLIIDGVLAQTGYRAFHEIIERTGIMPGMQRAIQYVKGDEARHLAWGTWVLARLSAEHGAAVQSAIRVQVDELAEPALAVVNDILATQPALPFGLTVEHFAEIAATQFRRRITRLETLQAMPLESLLRSSPGE